MALPQQEVPVSPKQSVVPEISDKILELNVSNKEKKSEPLRNNDSKIDSLKLEQSKNLIKTNLDTLLPTPDKNQSEIENSINNDE